MIKYGKFYEIKNRFLVDEFTFLSKAICKDETRYFLMCIHIEDKKLITTDGKRIHISDLSNFEADKKEEPFPDDGNYKLLRLTRRLVWLCKIEEMERSFPDWEEVVPSTKKSKYILTYFPTCRDGTGLAFSKLVNNCGEPIPINFDFIVDLGVKEYIFYYNEVDKAMTFKNDIRTAVIMPFKMD
jgi:hypothetical protein